VRGLAAALALEGGQRLKQVVLALGVPLTGREPAALPRTWLLVVPRDGAGELARGCAVALMAHGGRVVRAQVAGVPGRALRACRAA